MTSVYKGMADAQRMYELDVNSIGWESGAYFLMLVVDDEVFHHKMMLNDRR